MFCEQRLLNYLEIKHRSGGLNNASVTLTAPSTANGHVFEKWLKNGADFSTNLAITFNIVANGTYLASYTLPETVMVNLPDTTIKKNTIFELPIFVSDVSGRGIISFQFTLSFNQAVIAPSDPFVITTGTIAGAAGWSVSANPNNPGQLVVGGYGAQELSGSGGLLKLKFDAMGDLGQQTAVTFNDFTFNAGNPAVQTINGNVLIQPKVCGDADENGIIQAYDAALIVQHGIGLIILPEQGAVNADVNEDDLITAFDAALTLREAIGLPMPAGVETCFDAKFGYAEKLPDHYKFNARIKILKHSQFTSIAEIELSGIEAQTQVYALSFDIISPNASIQNFAIPNLPIGYLMYSNPVNENKTRVAIINPLGVLTKDLPLVFHLNFLKDGAVLTFDNIMLNNEALPDIVLYESTSGSAKIQGNLIAFPNPFNTSTSIEYSVEQKGQIKVEVLDQLGRNVKTLADCVHDTGYFKVVWNGDSDTGTAIKQGWYIIRMRSTESIEQIKVNLIY